MEGGNRFRDDLMRGGCAQVSLSDDCGVCTGVRVADAGYFRFRHSLECCEFKGVYFYESVLFMNENLPTSK